MSTSRDGATRGGRDRAATFNGGTPRGPSRGTGGASSSSGRGGSNASRGVFDSPFRGNGAPPAQARTRGQASPFATQPAMGRGGRGLGGAPATGSWQERQEKLKAYREREKKDAVAQGLMTDPDKAVALADAITLVGTCEDMCSEYEMTLRVNRNEVFPEERVNGDPNGEPDESRFVKAFKRSEAGAEVQLPSDLRPPASLKRTCDYLFNEIIGTSSFLGKVHHFVWDRTRAIRNDFSIQQLTKLDDLRIAIECYERIARFHIVSLHQLALAKKSYAKYDSQQEREQLDRTLLSLMQYYDDTRGRLENTNEAEFRAYCVIFAITNPVPDLEDRVQTWPRQVTKDKRVQTALELYATACETTYKQGPLPPKAKPVIAQQDWQKFWTLVKSRRLSYLAACVSEIFFNMIREIALKSLIRCTRASRRTADGSVAPNTELTLEAVAEALQYDSVDDLYAFVARWGLEFQSGADDAFYLDIRNVAGTVLSEPTTGPTQQKSLLVEDKRFGRTLPAIIDGLTVRQAADQGMIVEEERQEDMEGVEEQEYQGVENGDEGSEDDENSLFVGASKQEQEQSQQILSTEDAPGKLSVSNVKPAAFSLTGTSFGTSPFGAPPGTFDGVSNTLGSSGFGQPSNAFNTLKPAEASQREGGTVPAPKPAFGGGSNPFGKPAATNSPFAQSPFGAPALGGPRTNPFAPSTSLELTAATEAAASKSLFAGLSAFGAPSTTTAQPALGTLELTEPKTPGRIKKGPFEEDPSPVQSGPTTQDFPKPDEASKPPSPSTTQPANESPAAPSLFAQPETNLKSAPAPQPPPTAAPPSASAQSTTSPPPPSNAQSATQRRSSDWDNTKPKRPSPLQNSFTATDDSTARTTHLPDSQWPTPPAKVPPPAVERTVDEVLTEVAEAVTFDPAWGIWKQFVDFQVSQIIASAKKKVEYELAIEQARVVLEKIRARDVGRWWRGLARQRRLTAKGKALRERTRRRLQESTVSKGSSVATMGNSISSLGASGAASRPQPNGGKQGNTDLLLQSVARGRQPHLGGHTQAGSKRAASAYGSDVAASTYSPMHKRQKSMSHVEDRGKLDKTTPTSDLDDDMLKRSSFLGFSGRDAQQRANTTKSTYFRMKALGLQSRRTGADSAAPRGVKRQRSESLGATSMPPPARPNARNAVTAISSSPEAPSVTSARSVRPKTDEEDDILFARLKAARESLRDGEKFMKDEVAKEELRRSMNDSQSSNESPSLARARAEARLRASRSNSEIRERDVPAYRMRESRFVPREEYHLAQDRARQMRSSRDNSRAASREGSRPPDVARTVPGGTNESDTASLLFDSPPKPAQPTKPSSGFHAPPPTTTKPSFGFGAPSQSPAAQFTAPASATRDPFSQSSSFAPPTNGHNPFLQTFGATNATSFDTSPHNNTLPPSRINGTLVPSFGQPSQFAQIPFSQASQKSPSPPQPNSYMSSQAASEAISLLSGDAEETQEQSHQEHGSGEGSYDQQAFLDESTNHNIDAAFAERSVTLSFDQQEAASQTLLLGAYNYTSNPFAALADGVSEDEQQLDEGDDGQHFEQPDRDDIQPETAPQPDSYQYSEDQEGDYESDGMPDYQFSDEEAGPNGYIDEEAEDDGEIEDEDGSIEEDDGLDGDQSDIEEVRPDDWDSDADGHWDFSDEDEDDEPHTFAPLNSAYNRRVVQAAPQKDPALQEVGNTVEEAIELSD